MDVADGCTSQGRHQGTTEKRPPSDQHLYCAQTEITGAIFLSFPGQEPGPWTPYFPVTFRSQLEEEEGFFFCSIFFHILVLRYWFASAIYYD